MEFWVLHVIGWLFWLGSFTCPAGSLERVFLNFVAFMVFIIATVAASC